ncbi:hypothetical protein N431DRAFT_434509, partial [Stipitochalara longipes BDJ]
MVAAIVACASKCNNQTEVCGVLEVRSAGQDKLVALTIEGGGRGEVDCVIFTFYFVFASSFLFVCYNNRLI